MVPLESVWGLKRVGHKAELHYHWVVYRKNLIAHLMS